MHINFEEDKKEVLDMSTDNDKKSLSDQVEKLKDLEDSIVAKEEELKQLKQQADAISGEVIPTMMQELNISTLKLADGSAVEVKPVYGASISAEKKKKHLNGFVVTAWVILLKMRLLFLLAETKITRQ
jgi:hypothetical protein